MRSMIRGFVRMGVAAAVAGVLGLTSAESAEARLSACNPVDAAGSPDGQAPVRQAPELAPAPISRWPSPGPGTPTAC